jgi:hypothetical protein
MLRRLQGLYSSYHPMLFHIAVGWSQLEAYPVSDPIRRMRHCLGLRKRPSSTQDVPAHPFQASNTIKLLRALLGPPRIYMAGRYGLVTRMAIRAPLVLSVCRPVLCRPTGLQHEHALHVSALRAVTKVPKNTGTRK